MAKQIMKLTDKESALVAKVVSEGHTQLELEKSEGEFRVGYRYKGGGAWGGQAFVYNIKTAWNETIEDIQALEQELSKLRK